MEANGVQRTPLGNPVSNSSMFKSQQPPRSGWQEPMQPVALNQTQSMPGLQSTHKQSHRSQKHHMHHRPTTISVPSDSEHDSVEGQLFGFSKPRRPSNNQPTTNWSARHSISANPQGSGPTPFAQPRKSSGFKPAVMKR
ncbi:hypothetical protein BDV98DRAFT_560583 [Pterulicium gracile]|uniref:Uncharacterized protein n=1 Tax=Pterulicium gracile TaxID=1884261 RepID=A0A5C3QWN2_9AGAR|nr:hypothetical protein BDV98DRAFT_560583 [Pterula gracilis]